MIINTSMELLIQTFLFKINNFNNFYGENFFLFNSLRTNLKVALFEEKSLNWKFHRSIYYDITLWKFFSLRFQKLRQIQWAMNVQNTSHQHYWVCIANVVNFFFFKSESKKKLSYCRCWSCLFWREKFELKVP